MTSTFNCRLDWSGAIASTSRGVETFSRDLTVSFGGAMLPMSAAPDFHGDPSRVNPEQLYVASLSACQALTYLFLAARSAVVIVSYADDAEGTLQLSEGRMRMTRVVLRPRIVVADEASVAKARELIERAHRACYIANSVSAAVAIEPIIDAAARAA
jgi:organic hydroperoxide reductase OsmC/OhrA